MSAQVRELPEQRLALLDEAATVASAPDAAHPYRGRVPARALAAGREREGQRPQQM
ncbi:hypothetical protein [Streptomyces sp. NPDC048282]|uniref:hypothetical protein n=1 Tax=Streptomyces sp. NPDC048282 TaxID=3365528 RepID=UPI0037120ED4